MTIKREKFVNDAATTLNGSIDDTVTTITVTDGSVFPATGDFRALIDSEIVLVTDRSTNDLTATRGIEGTSAGSHGDGSIITAIVTADAIKTISRDSLIFWGATTPELLFKNGNILLDSTDFSWVNQGSATAIDDAHVVTLKSPTNSGAIGFRGMFRPAPSTPYEIKSFGLFGIGFSKGSTGTALGVGFRESSTGKLMIIDIRQDDLARVVKMTNPTTLSATAASIDNVFDRAWFKIEDDGVDLKFSLSVDDDTYVELFSETRTTFMAGGPDEVGFVINPFNISASSAYAHFSVWDE